MIIVETYKKLKHLDKVLNNFSTVITIGNIK